MIKEILNDFKNNRCPLCRSVEVEKIDVIDYPVPVAFSDTQITVKKSPEYWRCHKCASYFVENVISEANAKDLYGNNKSNKWNYGKFEEDKTADLVRQVSNITKAGANVLDIGCNDGNFLNFIKLNASVTFGVEFSQIGRETCASNGHQVFPDLDSVPVNLKFDFIFAFDLVEHLYNIENFFNFCRSHLKGGGKLVILTGNPNCLSARCAGVRWWYINNPEHIIFPSKSFFTNLSDFRLEQYRPVFNSRGYHAISVCNFLRPMNIIKAIAKMVLRRYDGTPLIDKDHALIILNRI